MKTAVCGVKFEFYYIHSIWCSDTFLPPANEVCEGYVFTGVCLSTVGHAWQGACMAGGCVWQGEGGMHGGGGGVYGGGCVWWGGACVVGGVHGRRPPTDTMATAYGQ